MILFLLLIAGLVFLGGPGLIRAGRGHPAHFARNGLAVQLIGFVLVEAGLLLWASPAILDLAGATDLARICRAMLGGLLPPGWQVGVAAGVAALVLAGLAVRGALRARALQRNMRVEALLGDHHIQQDHDLVVLPVDDALAYTVGGRPPQVVISQGLIAAVGQNGLEAVCAHEAVHARHRHHRYLLALAGIGSAFTWYPPARRGARMVRLALERWADEEAGEHTTNGRDNVRRALVSTAFALAGPEVAAFGSADTLMARVRALAAPPPRSSPVWVTAGYLTVWVTGVLAVGVLGWATRMSILAVTNPGLCIV